MHNAMADVGDNGPSDRPNVGAILDELSHLIPLTEGFYDAIDNLLRSKLVVETIKEDLEITSASTDKAVYAARLAAEMAKADAARGAFIESGLASLLVPKVNSCNRELSLHSVRTLGNMCYENDQCREQILQQGGLAEVESLLKFCLEKHNTMTHLKTACCGFLHNLINGNEACQKAVLTTDIVPTLKRMIDLNADSAAICNFCFMALSSVTETEGGKELLCKSEVPNALLKIFVSTNIKDIDELLINLMSSLAADSDDVKLLIAESSADMHLLSVISLLSGSTEEDDQQLVKAASELLVLVLTGDEAMKIWFDGGNGFVFKSVCEWLHNTNGQLLQSAAFALGNFARDDMNSSVIIQQGISLEICKCLDQLQGFMEDARTAPTIHAMLSALRNLAIAPSNKVQLLGQDALSHILPYTDCENTIVTSKLVGVLRLIIDKNENCATMLGKDIKLIQRLVMFSASEHNMLLKGESARCLAWIIKNSRDKVVLENSLTYGTYPHLLFLVSSEHTVMQNEGLISLILLLDTCPDMTKKLVKESNLITSLVMSLSKEELPPLEVAQNTLMLINNLAATDLKEDIQQSNMVEILDKLITKYKSDVIENLVQSIKSYIHPNTYS